MMTSEILMRAWSELEAEPDQELGVYTRRIFADSPFGLFAVLVRPGMNVQLRMNVDSSVGTDGLERETRGFRVLRHYVSAFRTTCISLELSHAAFRKLFEVMTQDAVATVLATSDESSAVAALRSRLNHWERFMQSSGPDGLSREDQIGLFGELSFLRAMLANGVSGHMALAAWKGPSGANQDYEICGRTIEVKTTTGNSGTTTKISNEFQLDETDTPILFLLHLWLKQQADTGISLPQLVDELHATLSGADAQEFADRLVQAGYHEVHRALYEKTGYVERHRRYYVVEGTFPRIRQTDLRPSVKGVEYGIDLAGFEEYLRNEDEVIKVLVGEPT